MWYDRIIGLAYILLGFIILVVVAWVAGWMIGDAMGLGNI
jgi:hypothetical protein